MTEPPAPRPKPPKPTVREDEIDFSAICAQGAGGQNVNKVSNAVHARFDVRASSLPDAVKERLLALSEQRLTGEGVIVIKAQSHRSLEMNRTEAIERLQALVDAAAHVPRVRRATRPTRGSQRRRLDGKAVRADIKAGRGKVRGE